MVTNRIPLWPNGNSLPNATLSRSGRLEQSFAISQSLASTWHSVMKYLPNAWSNPTNESIKIGALLENVLNSNVVRFTTHNQTCLQYIRFFQKVESSFTFCKSVYPMLRVLPAQRKRFCDKSHNSYLIQSEVSIHATWNLTWPQLFKCWITLSSV